MKFLQNNKRAIFYTCWLILAVVQSRYTELLNDEAYYWVYSLYPDWGYFDHPPMIALMIKAGYAVFQNELGVRLIAILMNLFSIMIIERLVANKNQQLFFIIILSVAVLQVGGFLAVPDAPLMFFTAVFFWAYNQFANNASWENIFKVAIAALLLLYSKYHGILIILFTLLSDISLLKRYKTYIIATIILIGFLPHLYWQYTHDWPSIQYHLFERNATSYKVTYTLEYILGQFLLPGPLAGFILLPAAFLYKAKNKTCKALYFSMTGIYIFFLISSLRGFVEANWTAPAMVPLIVLSHNYLNEKKRMVLILKILLPLTLILILVARVAMMVDFIPLKFIKERYHAWGIWPEKMKAKTNGLPVVFNNSYQRASKYRFYTGQISYSPSAYDRRMTNYDFWPIEDSLLGKQVFILDHYDPRYFQDSLATPIGVFGYRYDPYYLSFAKAKFITDSSQYLVGESDSVVVQGRVVIPEGYKRFITKDIWGQLKINVGIFNKKGHIKNIPVSIPYDDVQQSEYRISFFPNLPAENYLIQFSIQNGINVSTHNSRKVKLNIK